MAAALAGIAEAASVALAAELVAAVVGFACPECEAQTLNTSPYLDYLD